MIKRTREEFRNLLESDRRNCPHAPSDCYEEQDGLMVLHGCAVCKHKKGTEGSPAPSTPHSRHGA